MSYMRERLRPLIARTTAKAVATDTIPKSRHDTGEQLENNWCQFILLNALTPVSFPPCRT